MVMSVPTRGVEVVGRTVLRAGGKVLSPPPAGSPVGAPPVVDEATADEVVVDEVDEAPADEVVVDEASAENVDEQLILPDVSIDHPTRKPTAFELVRRRREQREALEAEGVRKEEELKEFRKSRGAVGVETAKMGKSPIWYAPFGWNDRPSWAPRPAAFQEERHRYGLGDRAGGTNIRGETLDDLELSRGQMFAGGWIPRSGAVLPPTAANMATRLEGGIANIQGKIDLNDVKLADLGERITQRERYMALIDEVLPRKPDGSVAHIRPATSEGAREVLEDFREKVLGAKGGKEEYTRPNYESMEAAYDEIKEEADALRPEFRRAKLLGAQLMMAKDKYGSMYMDLPTDHPDKQPK